MKKRSGLPRFLPLCLGVLTFFDPAHAAAQNYPNRPIKWVISFPAGGANDVVARIIGQFLSERLGQQVIIENRAGAGGSLGMQSVLSSPPDGYTIGFAAPNYSINATLYEKLPYRRLEPRNR
jgi:tripartite-type tricarboxylate transporter receptor subunit TctC